ncbi:MAG: hypothetical protein V4660_10430 [Pseudomonadota bacterium]
MTFLKLLALLTLNTIMFSAFGANANKSVHMPDNFVAECERNFPKSEVKVSVKEGSITESNQESIRSLTALAQKTKVIHADQHRTLGLTAMELSWGIDAEFKSLGLDQLNMHCGRPTIKIELEVINHLVRIAKEFAPESCEYNFVHEHEYKHVRLNKKNIKRYAKEVTDALNERFPNPVIYGSSEKVSGEMQRMMDNELLPFFKKVTTKIESEGIELHKLIDTPEEYAKGNKVCAGNISRIIRESDGQ